MKEAFTVIFVIFVVLALFAVTAALVQAGCIDKEHQENGQTNPLWCK